MCPIVIECGRGLESSGHHDFMSASHVSCARPGLQVLNAVTRKLPFFVSSQAEGEAGEAPPREELRLKHRVLDLRWVAGGGGEVNGVNECEDGESRERAGERETSV